MKDKVSEILNDDEKRFEAVIDKIEKDDCYPDVEVPADFHKNLSKQIEVYKRNEELKQEILSEEEKEALEIGKKVLEQKRYIREKRKKINKGLLTAASIVFFVTVGLAITVPRVDAGGGFIGFLIDLFGGETRSRVELNDDYMETENDEEVEAYQKAEIAMGGIVARLPNNVRDLEFISANIDEKTMRVDMRYLLGGSDLMYSMHNENLNASFALAQEEELIETFLVEGESLNFAVNEFKNKESGEVEYGTTFNYEGMSYTIMSCASKKEFINLLEKIILNSTE